MKSILLISTGGTIASKNNGDGLLPCITSSELLGFIPEIENICSVDTKQILNIDSTNIQPEYWVLISNTIKENYDKYDGFVISHGTDTMAYTAAALSYLIQNADKPVIVTGSQKPIDEKYTDAKRNLLDSFLLASQDNIYGIHVVFNSKVIIGTRAKKTHTKSYDAFESINFPYIATINNNKVVNMKKEYRPKEKIMFSDQICSQVFLLKLIPGMNPNILDFVKKEYKGIVIESYGMGGIPFNEKRNFLKKMDDLTDNGVITVIATQATLDGSDMSVYEVGLKALNNYSILQTYDMTTEAAVTKLMWILTQTNEFSKAKELFYKTINEDIAVDVQ